jgi:hypothetical protein
MYRYRQSLVARHRLPRDTVDDAFAAPVGAGDDDYSLFELPIACDNCAIARLRRT